MRLALFIVLVMLMLTPLNGELVLYTLKGCPCCDKFKKELKEYNISFREVVVNSSRKYRELSNLYKECNLTIPVVFPTLVIREHNITIVYCGGSSKNTIKALKENNISYFIDMCEDSNIVGVIYPKKNKLNVTNTSKSCNSTLTLKSQNTPNLTYLYFLYLLTNPCMITLFSYLLLRMDLSIKEGLLFIGSVVATFLLMSYFLLLPISNIGVLILFSVLCIVVGIVRIVECLLKKKFLIIPKSLVKLLTKLSNPILAGILYTLVLTPCLYSPFMLINQYSVLFIVGITLPLLVLLLLKNYLKESVHIQKYKMLLKIVNGTLLIVFGAITLNDVVAHLLLSSLHF